MFCLPKPKLIFRRFMAGKTQKSPFLGRTFLPIPVGMQGTSYRPAASHRGRDHSPLGKFHQLILKTPAARPRDPLPTDPDPRDFEGAHIDGSLKGPEQRIVGNQEAKEPTEDGKMDMLPDKSSAVCVTAGAGREASGVGLRSGQIGRVGARPGEVIGREVPPG